jgi:hypothetical protein
MENSAKSQPNFVLRHLPILTWLPKYQRTWLRTDLSAGLLWLPSQSVFVRVFNLSRMNRR